MKRRDKIINGIGIAACVLGFGGSLAAKNYIACVLWLLLLLQDLREWSLEKIIETQRKIIEGQDLVIKNNEK